jgi:hypothetical protein
MYRERPSPARLSRATELVRRMGYEFHIREAEFSSVTTSGTLSVRLRVQNRGVAPFYYDWPVELALLDQKRTVTASWPTGFKLTGILPGSADAIWSHTQKQLAHASGAYKLVLRVVNPLSNGQPLHFANVSQDVDLPGWLTLGTLEVTRP